MSKRITIDVPAEILAEIEVKRAKNKSAENPVQRAKSDSLESYILYLVECGLGEQ